MAYGRRLSRLLIGIFGGGLVACMGDFPRQPVGGTLRLLTWEGYAPEDLIEKFETETGVEVEITYIFDNTDIVETLKASNGEGYDLAFPSLREVKLTQETWGIYQAIDLERIEHPEEVVKTLMVRALSTATLEEELYALPAVWGTSGLIVNTAYIDRENITSYRDLCDPQYEGRVTYRYQFPTFLGAMYALGYDPFLLMTEEPDNVAGWRAMMEAAYTYLLECRNNVHTYWTTRQENIDLMLQGKAYLAQGWDGTAWLLNAQNPNIQYVAPREGALGWIDTFAIPEGADNLDAVYAFINFMYEPENAGQLTASGGFFSAVKGAIAYWPEDTQRLVNESMPPAVIDNINWYAPRSAEFDAVVVEYVEKLRVATGNARSPESGLRNRGDRAIAECLE